LNARIVVEEGLRGHCRGWSRFRRRSMCVFELNTLTHTATPDAGAECAE
jgi:hypothetical protein